MLTLVGTTGKMINGRFITGLHSKNMNNCKEILILMLSQKL